MSKNKNDLENLKYCDDGRPIFYCQTKGQQYTFKCPKCKQTRHHGKGDGYRASHCVTECWPHGYYLFGDTL